MPLNYRPLTGALSALCLASVLAIPNAGAEVSKAKKLEAQALLESIIPYRTAKGYGQMSAMTDVLVERLKRAGFSDEDIVRVPLEIDGEMTNGLLVRFAAQGIPAAPPVAFLAHMDVVDALPANWETDPFTPVIKDGYIYGRGTQDNKFGVALLVSSFANLKESGFAPRRNLLLAFAGDEETGMLTTQAILKHPFVRDTEYALNSDAGGGSMLRDGTPVGFSMQSAEKTYVTFKLGTRNPGGHSSAPQPDNAIYDLARALVAIDDYTFPVQFNPITRSMARALAEREGGELGTALQTLLENPEDAAALAIMQGYPQYSNMLWTTCVATMLDAGLTENALPQSAVATVNCRILPDTGGAEQVTRTLAQVIGNDEVSISISRASVESPASPIREDLLSLLEAAVAINYPGMTLQPTMSSGGTEGREYRSAGIPTYGAGSLALVRPDDSRAHGINERIPLSSFYKEMDYWDYVMRQIGGGEQ